MEREVLRAHLDELANRSRRVLVRWHRHRALRLSCRHALLWLLAPAVGLFLMQVASALGAAPTPPVRLWLSMLVTIAAPVLYVVARVAWASVGCAPDRRVSLAVFDRQLGTPDHLVTADEFLGLVDRVPDDQTRRFMLAAIDDAKPAVEVAVATSLDARPLPTWQISSGSWASVLAATVLIVAAMWLNTPRREDAADEIATVVPDESAATTASADRSVQGQPRLDVRKAVDDRRVEAASMRPSPTSSTREARVANEAMGPSQSGGQADSRSSSGAAGSSGTPSNQQSPSKALSEDEPPPLPMKDSMSRALAHGQKQPDARLAANASSGQGQSTSSSTDTTNIPADDRPDRAGAQKDDGTDEEGLQDEAEEEKTAGVEKPTLRRSKPAVDRNLSPLPTGDQSSPLDNGRSGPGGRKKTRGVPSMILGVPIPDRIQGMKHPGRSKVTQESATPTEEPPAPADAESRLPRDRPFGSIEHPVLPPWMQHIVEEYFMQLRERKGEERR